MRVDYKPAESDVFSKDEIELVQKMYNTQYHLMRIQNLKEQFAKEQNPNPIVSPNQKFTPEFIDKLEKIYKPLVHPN